MNLKCAQIQCSAPRMSYLASRRKPYIGCSNLVDHEAEKKESIIEQKTMSRCRKAEEVNYVPRIRRTSHCRWSDTSERKVPGGLNVNR
ncbi:hypothetical protein TNCV_1004931 [Trichonephila clavipes]|nr:hypothetical protein TNCV_1004931 [Trichonephila clavipes]